MYTIHDTFNDRVVSRHRTLAAAVKAKEKFGRTVRRYNGPGSYIPTVITHAGKQVPENKLLAAEQEAGF